MVSKKTTWIMVICAVVIIGVLVLIETNSENSNCVLKDLPIPEMPTSEQPTTSSENWEMVAPGESFGVYIRTLKTVSAPTFTCQIATHRIVSSQQDINSVTTLYEIAINPTAVEGKHLCSFTTTGKFVDFVWEVRESAYVEEKIDPTKRKECAYLIDY